MVVMAQYFGIKPVPVTLSRTYYPFNPVPIVLRSLVLFVVAMYDSHLKKSKQRNQQ
jgi:hypothetical protein